MQSESKEIDNETCAHHAPVNNYLFTINNKSTRESSMKNVAWNRSRLFFYFQRILCEKRIQGNLHADFDIFSYFRYCISNISSLPQTFFPIEVL